ncbi:PIN domain-like protein [Amanita rubescens]|nr:PIN domain-like protein [Amanita rubescens]
MHSIPLQHLVQTTDQRSFLELSMAEGFTSDRRGLRCLIIGISARAWIQKKPARNLPGENTVLCEAFHRLARLLEFPVVPIFVFDGGLQASQKRGREGQAAAQQLASSFRHLLLAFGFNIHLAPAGAEEELAALCRSHLIDVVITDNISTFVYGATHVIQDMEFLNSTDDMTRIYTSSMAEADAGLPLSRGDWILLALLHGLRGCGLATALRIIKSNLGTALFEAAEHSSLPDLDQFMKSWRRHLQRELTTDPNQHLGRQHIILAQAVDDSFPSTHDIIQLLRPITSLSNGQLGPDTSLWVPCIPDLGRLGHLCELLFPWATGPGVAREFDHHVWRGTCNRLLLTVSHHYPHIQCC